MTDCGNKVCRFITRHCVHTQGQWVGKPFALLPWQHDVIHELFSLGENGLRRYRWALIGCAKKSGKSEMLAARGLYLLLGDGEPSALGAVAAASEDQANIVYGAARTMCEMSPTLRLLTKCFDKEILVPSKPGCKLRRVAAQAGTNDGPSYHFVLVDEAHEWVTLEHRRTWDVLTNAVGARRQPMILAISTAGLDLDGSLLGNLYQHGRKVEAGTVSDPRLYFRWYEAPDSVDWRSEEAWAAANPSYGHTVQRDFYEDMLTKRTESVFRRYFANQWVTAENVWCQPSDWDACRAPEDWDLDPELPTFIGVDVAKNIDASAIAVVQRRETEDGIRYYATAQIWSNPHPPGTAAHAAYTNPNHELVQVLRDLHKGLPRASIEVDGEIRSGPAIAWDPWRFRAEAMQLETEGLTLIETPQSDARMTVASQCLFELVKRHELAHDGDPEFRAHVLNAVAEQRARGWRLSRPAGSRRPIDACIALAIAVSLAQSTPVPEEYVSIYESRPLLVLG